MRQFRVVTHKNWLAEQFAPMGAVQDHGFDIDPRWASQTIWWAPGAFVAAARKAGVHLPLMSCGPRWLGYLPTEWRGRVVTTRTVKQWMGDSYELGGPVNSNAFVKLPEAKLDNFPARIHLFNRHFPATLAQYNLPEDTLVQVQGVVDFVMEARFWIAHGEITTGSYYRAHNTVWGDEEWDDVVALMRPVLNSSMCARASAIAKEMAGPPGYVLDCGVTNKGAVLVVEANAAWSSGPYDGDPAGIYEAIKASHDFDGKYPQWAWSPNPVLYGVQPLKVMTP